MLHLVESSSEEKTIYFVRFLFPYGSLLAEFSFSLAFIDSWNTLVKFTMLHIVALHLVLTRLFHETAFPFH
jgi:hypothetical protein